MISRENAVARKQSIGNDSCSSVYDKAKLFSTQNLNAIPEKIKS